MKCCCGIITIGLATVVSGVIYGLVTFGGVPTADASPQLRAAEQYHAQVAGLIMLPGVVLFIIGAIGLFFCALNRLWKGPIRSRAHSL
jgi:hypothetical protein